MFARTLCLAAAAVFASVAPATAQTASSEWRPLSLGADAVDPGSGQRLRLDADGTVTVFAGCNGYAGRYRHQGSAFRVVSLAGSRRIFAARTMHKETMLYAVLKTARQARRDGPLLRLYDGKAREIASFIRAGGE